MGSWNHSPSWWVDKQDWHWRSSHGDCSRDWDSWGSQDGDSHECGSWHWRTPYGQRQWWQEDRQWHDEESESDAGPSHNVAMASDSAPAEWMQLCEGMQVTILRIQRKPPGLVFCRDADGREGWLSGVTASSAPPPPSGTRSVGGQSASSGSVTQPVGTAASSHDNCASRPYPSSFSTCCSVCGLRFYTCSTVVEQWQAIQCLMAQGLQKSKAGGNTCFDCRAQAGRGTLQNVLQSEMFPACSLRHGLRPPIPRLQHLHHLLPALDDALCDFWRYKPVFEWDHPGGGGWYPSGGAKCFDHNGQERYISEWDGSHYGSRAWSRIDFFRPACDWSNADWDEVCRGCEDLCEFLLPDFRATQRASWIECMVGSVYHVSTNGAYLTSSAISVRSTAGKEIMLRQLRVIWDCLRQLTIPMPDAARPSFDALPMPPMLADVEEPKL